MNWIPVNNTTFNPETLPQRILASRFSKDVFVWVEKVNRPDICAYDYGKRLWVDCSGNYYIPGSISHWCEVEPPSIVEMRKYIW